MDFESSVAVTNTSRGFSTGNEFASPTLYQESLLPTTLLGSELESQEKYITEKATKTDENKR